MKARTIAATLIAFCISLIAVTIVAQQSKPGAPTITSVGGAPITLTVVWTAPNSDGGASITSYDVRYIGSVETDRADERWTEVIGAWTSGNLTYTITGLPGNVSYDVQVRAVNEIGAGEWSALDTAIVVAPPQVSVSIGELAYTVLEGETLEVPITLSADPQRTVTIPIQARNGYRTWDDDYSVQRSVQFNPGQTQKMVAFTAHLDRRADSGSVQLRFGTLPAGVTAGATSQATVSITDTTLRVNFKLQGGLDPYYDNVEYTVREGDTVTVTVELRPDPQRTVVIPLIPVHNSSTTSPADYTMPPSLTFNSGETSKTFTFEALHDDENDDSDSVLIDFVANKDMLPPGVKPAHHTWATFFIIDDDVPQVRVSFGVGVISVPEGERRGVTVSLDGDPERTVVIPFTVTERGGATSEDYSVPTSVEFTSRANVKTIWLTANQDTVYDEGESVRIGFGSLPERVSVGSRLFTQTTFNIDDDGPQVTASFDHETYTVDEGGTAEVTVRLSADPERTVSMYINKRHLNGMTSGDYRGVPDQLTFNAGDESKSFNFSTVDDTHNDNGESLQLSLSLTSMGVTVGWPGQTTLRINDNDIPQIVRVSFAESRYIVDEGETQNLVVKLNRVPDRLVVIPITVEALGFGAADSDFSLQTSVEFNANERSKTVEFTANQDTEIETDDEVVWVSFGSLPVGVGLGGTEDVIVKIIDYRTLVEVSYGQQTYTVAEGGMQSVTIKLSADPQRTVVIPLRATGQDGATADDYSVSPTSVTFNAGDTSKTITFTATQDSQDDDDESVVLAFGTDLPRKVTAGTQATVSITDDDAAGVTVSETVRNIGEGSSETYTIVLASQPAADVIVTINDPSNTDVTANPDNLTFTSSDWSSAQTVTVSAAQDADAVNETATVTHSVTSGDSNYNGVTARSITVNVTDDDNRQFTVSYEPDMYTVAEGDMVTVTVTLNAIAGRTLLIRLSVNNQDGATSADYSGVPANLTFYAGDMSKTFTVTATDDVFDDDGESVRLGFGVLPSGVSAGRPATVSITDNDDPQVTVSYGQATYTVAEGDMVTVTVRLSADPERSVEIPITATDQDGASSSDYTGVPGSLTFNRGDRSKSFSFSASEDDLVEEGERVLLGFRLLPNRVAEGRPNEATVNLVDEPGVAGSSPGRGGGGGGGGGGGPPPVPVPSDVEFDWNVTRDIESLHRDNDLPTGLWSNGEVLWVVENSASGADRLFAYNLNTGERLEQHEFELDARNRFSHGIWSDDQLVWIADSGQDKLFAYQLASGERAEERDLELDERNRDPREIWSNGELILVLDGVKKALFGYELESGRLLAEYPLDKLNQSPRGIWSDGFTIWVSDDGANRIFAYRMEGEMLNRHEDQEFTFRSLLKAGNGEARGIWSDGDVIFVADEQDEQIYTYNMPDTIDARLASLTLSDVEFGEFSAGRTEYAAVVDSGLAQTTVEAEAAQSTAGIEITPADADGDPSNGHQARLIDGQEITVEVTSADGSRTVVYRVGVSHCLSGLSETRLNSVQFVGGSVEALGDCAQSLGVDALYHYRDSAWVGLFLEAPEFLNRPFRDRFAEGVPGGEVLIGKRDAIQITTQAVSGAG